MRTKEWQPFEARKEAVIALLKKSKPLTIEQIAESLGMSVKGIASLIVRIREQGCFVYVQGFSGNGPHAARFYAYGLKPDAEYVPIHKPRAVAESEEEALDLKRRQKLIDQIKPFRHWQDEAFFGSFTWSSSTESPSGVSLASQSALA